MQHIVKAIVLGLVVLAAAIATNFARDLAYQIHAIIILLLAGYLFIREVGKMEANLCRWKPDTWTALSAQG